MGRRSSSAASSPTVSGTRLGAYPQVRVATHHYASSDTTLAESLPPSPRNQPPPYGEDVLAEPPLYHDDSFGREKRHGEPLPRKTLIIRLFTSIFIAFIVCLIVAAVVGRIHDTKLNNNDAQDAAAHSANGTRFTMMVENMNAQSTSTAPSATLVATLAANQTAPTHTSIARPTGTIVSTYSCPYIAPSTTHTSQGSTGTWSSEPSLCGLTVPFKAARNDTGEDSVVDISLHSLKDCVIGRTSYRMLSNKLGYRCALSCSEEGGPGIDGLEDGWKWRCG